MLFPGERLLGGGEVFQPRGGLLGGAEVFLLLSSSGRSLKCGEVSLGLGWLSCEDSDSSLSDSSGL